MRKNDEKPAGAARDVRFRLPDGRIVDLPAMRWVLANRQRFAPRMALSAFLRMAPLWLIKDVEHNAERARSGGSGDGIPTSAAILTLEHLRMWSANPICGFRPSRSAIPADADHPFRQGDHPGRDAAG